MMYRKKLIEVALPLKAINEASAKEKSIRHGHPSTLHLWWARRPLAACRAVLFASLVNDPSDDPMYGVNEDIAASERAKLFNLIEELVRWENSNNSRVINAARAEIARSIAANRVADGEWKDDRVIVTVGAETATVHDFKHKLAAPAKVNAFLAKHAPPVLDPFCGGGSIPLEAQRLGLRAYGSDLNPVAVLITKALVEIPSNFAARSPVNPEWQTKSKAERSATVWQGAQGLADDVRYYGRWMRNEAEKNIGHLYPKVRITAQMAKQRPDLEQYVGQLATVIAWRIARTLASPDPSYQGAHVPLLSTYWLNDKVGQEAWLSPEVHRNRHDYTFHINIGPVPATERKAVSEGTKMARGKFRCLLSGQPIPPAYVKQEGLAQRFGTRTIAIVAQIDRTRLYLAGYESTNQTIPETDFLEELPCPDISGYFNPPIYGYKTFGSLFSARQKAALASFAALVDGARTQCIGDGKDEQYANAVATYLALAVSRLSNRLNTFCIWHSGRQTVEQIFSEQGVPMAWDYAEANPFSDATGSWKTALDWIPRCVENSPCGFGLVTQLDAAHVSSGDAFFLVSTDPPYYSSITYADFADFFYGTLRKCLRGIYPQLLSTMTCPKEAEAVAAWHRFNGDRDAASAHFTNKLLASIRASRAVSGDEYPLTIYYAFKQQDLEADDGLLSAWESILTVVMEGDLTIRHTWPMRTEQVSGRKSYKNSLASSIVIVCRPASSLAGAITRRQFLDALREELPAAVRHLQSASIAPVDLAQSAIGPGMAVFTRYVKVIESDGSSMSVRTAISIINQVLDEVLTEQEGEFDPDTRWALAWFEQFGMKEAPFGEADVLARAKNTAVNGLVEAGIARAKSGKVQLVGRAELPEDWNPKTDKRLTVWEMTQHLIQTLETRGETETAALLNKLGGISEIARDLSYRLYSICERQKSTDDALAYNSLVIAWPELSKLALASRNRQPSATQSELFT